MFTFILLSTAIFQCFLLLGAERPKYRLDYRYEKAFDNFYKLHPSATTWSDARIRCQSEDSELLIPDSLDEADAVPLLMTSILNKYAGIFVGIHDLYTERSFVTIRGTNMMDSILNLLWEHRQPEYKGGRCVAMRRTGRIYTHPCDSPLPFICKKIGKTIEFQRACNTFDKRWNVGPNQTCYFMHNEPQNWYQAYGSCLGAGGHLAVLNNQSEVDHLKELYKLHRPTRMPVDDFAFLGYSDLFQKHHYRTIHGERVEDLGYKEWELMCPVTYNKTYLRCGGMRRSGLLALADCDVPAVFFCEKPANTSKVKNILRLGQTNHARQPKHRPKNVDYNEFTEFS